jgi:hypothetical protein
VTPRRAGCNSRSRRSVRWSSAKALRGARTRAQ